MLFFLERLAGLSLRAINVVDPYSLENGAFAHAVFKVNVAGALRKSDCREAFI